MVRKHEDSSLASRLLFLDAASQLLLQSCPSVSSHAQLEYADLAHQIGCSLPDSKKHEACQGCGQAFDERSSKVHIERQKLNHESEEVASKEGTTVKSLISECKICRTKTRSPMKPTSRNVASKTKAPENQIKMHPRMDLAMTEADEGRLTRKQKQRMKKQQGSLQAMLEKSKAGTASSSGFGISLEDLLKK